ncbi:unnamed protein product [Victoria cruziana]
MEFAPQHEDDLRGDCSTLVVPALSIGNVGQLAVDLLISSLRADRVGYLNDPSVLPCVGNDAYGPVPQGVLALPLEVYEVSSSELSIIQQRSPVIKGMMIEFSRNLASYAATTGKQHVVVLSSLDSGKKQKCDDSRSHIYYISSGRQDGSDDFCEKLGWKRLQEYAPDHKRWQYLSSLADGNPVLEEESVSFDDELVLDDYYPSLPFAALFSCCKAKGLKVTCILCYCAEGDNTPDSFILAEAALNLLGLDKGISNGEEGTGGWIIPLSWKTVYGPPPDMSLF